MQELNKDTLISIINNTEKQLLIQKINYENQLVSLEEDIMNLKMALKKQNKII